MRAALSFAIVSMCFATSCGGETTAAPGAASPPAVPPVSTPTAPPPASAAQPASQPSTNGPLTTQAIAAIVAAPDRSDMDRKIDVKRHPADLLAFFGAGPGMTVADLGAGGGYTTELLARAVGPTGKVYGQNSPDMLKKFAEKPWSARLALPANKVVIRADRPLDDPLPPEAKNLDLVEMYIFYHDTVWIGTDRDKMNKAVFDALKPGGSYVIVDASAKDGHGIGDVKSLHRIEQSVVENEVKKAGFKIAASADFLRNPADTRDWSSSPKDAGDRVGTEDRFTLKFTRP